MCRNNIMSLRHQTAGPYVLTDTLYVCRSLCAENKGLTNTFSKGTTVTRYPTGMGWVMTYDVAKYIADNAPNLFMGYPEDAVVGLWLTSTKFTIQHDERFHDWDWTWSCNNQSIIVHKHDGNVDADGVIRSCFPENYNGTGNPNWW